MTVTDKNVAPIYCCAQFVTQGSGSETFTKDIYDVRALNKSTKNVKEKITKSATVEEINAGLMGNKIFSPWRSLSANMKAQTIPKSASSTLTTAMKHKNGGFLEIERRDAREFVQLTVRRRPQTLLSMQRSRNAQIEGRHFIDRDIFERKT